MNGDRSGEVPFAGVACEHCNKPGASREEEATHNTGECRCEGSRKLCWRAWLGTRCDWPEDGNPFYVMKPGEITFHWED